MDAAAAAAVEGAGAAGMYRVEFLNRDLIEHTEENPQYEDAKAPVEFGNLEEARKFYEDNKSSTERVELVHVLDDDVEYLAEMNNWQNGSTSDSNSDRDEGGANDLALGDAANGAGARSPFAQAAAADLVEVSPPVEVDVVVVGDSDSGPTIILLDPPDGSGPTIITRQTMILMETIQINEQFKAGDVAGAAARWNGLLAESRTLDWSNYEADFVKSLVDDINHAIHVGELGMPYVYLSDASSDSDSSDSDSSDSDSSDSDL
jgi:hypothetical protein